MRGNRFLNQKSKFEGKSSERQFLRSRSKPRMFFTKNLIFDPKIQNCLQVGPKIKILSWIWNWFFDPNRFEIWWKKNGKVKLWEASLGIEIKTSEAFPQKFDFWFQNSKLPTDKPENQNFKLRLNLIFWSKSVFQSPQSRSRAQPPKTQAPKFTEYWILEPNREGITRFSKRWLNKIFFRWLDKKRRKSFFT